MRRSLWCLVLLLVTIPFGLMARYGASWLPWFWQKYFGSMLWAVALYWLVAMLLPRLQAKWLCMIACAIALLVELSRLTPEPHVDAFRLTMAGKLLLGRYFSVKDIVAYFVAIFLTASVDTRLQPGRAHPIGQAN